MEEKFELTKAEEAVLRSWRSYVPSVNPNLRRYDERDHTIKNRTRLYYFMLEDLIEYFKQNKVPQYSATALRLMGVSASTHKTWRDKWGKIWRKMRL